MKFRFSILISILLLIVILFVIVSYFPNEDSVGIYTKHKAISLVKKIPEVQAYIKEVKSGNGKISFKVTPSNSEEYVFVYVYEESPTLKPFGWYQVYKESWRVVKYQ